MDLIETGKIVNTHGIKGDVKVLVWNDDPELIAGIDEFYIDGQAVKVESSRFHKGSLLVKFLGVDTLEKAENLKDKIISADSSLFELEEGEYFFRDLLGMDVFDADTSLCYGKITEIFRTGANDVYEVTDTDGRKRLVPAIKDCIISVDVATRKMVIKPLEGLFDI